MYRVCVWCIKRLESSSLLPCASYLHNIGGWESERSSCDVRQPSNFVLTKRCDCIAKFHFRHRMLSQSVCLSVCLSVRRVYYDKTSAIRITAVFTAKQQRAVSVSTVSLRTKFEGVSSIGGSTYVDVA